MKFGPFGAAILPAGLTENLSVLRRSKAFIAVARTRPKYLRNNSLGFYDGKIV